MLKILRFPSGAGGMVRVISISSPLPEERNTDVDCVLLLAPKFSHFYMFAYIVYTLILLHWFTSLNILYTVCFT